MSNTRRTQERLLRTYFNMLFPQPLNEHEYIRLIKMDKCSGFVNTSFVRTFDEFVDWVIRNRYKYDLYVGLATVQEKQGKFSGQASYNAKRHVLYLDFDKKDYPNIKDVQEFSRLISSKTQLFNHMVIDSGHGYHYYFCVEPTRDVDRLVELNKALAKLTGADMNAVKPTQIARIPCSYNHKIVDDEGNSACAYNIDSEDLWKYVTIVSNGMNTANFYRYNIQKLEKQIAHDSQTADRLKEHREAVSDYEPKMEKCFYCIDKIRNIGAVQGERNFWLGRIVNWHKLQGHNVDYAKTDIIRWNKLCDPPENEHTLIDSFGRYWNTDYKLLGCVGSIPDIHDREALERVCDKAKCLNSDNLPDIALKDGGSLKLSKGLLTPTKMKKLSGYHYLLLTLIYMMQDNYLTVSKLEDCRTMLVGYEGCKRKPYSCMTERKFRETLKELEDLKIINITPPKSNPNAQKSRHKVRMVRRYEIFRDGYIQFYRSACLAVRVGVISFNDYCVYLALIKRLQNGESCSYETLAKDLDMQTQNIHRSIKRLEQVNLLAVKKIPKDDGGKRNYYIVTDSKEVNDMVCEEDDYIEEITLTA